MSSSSGARGSPRSARRTCRPGASDPDGPTASRARRRCPGTPAGRLPVALAPQTRRHAHAHSHAHTRSRLAHSLHTHTRLARLAHTLPDTHAAGERDKKMKFIIDREDFKDNFKLLFLSGKRGIPAHNETPFVWRRTIPTSILINSHFFVPTRQ